MKSQVAGGEGTAIGGRYRLVERIAWGGMGEVWRAHDEQIERDVAVKLLRDDFAADPAAVERFRREARMAASLTHPNVASVFDVVDGERPAIVMELVRGKTLAAVVKDGPLSIEHATVVADGLFSALEAAHASGIVHRDVTPGNVLISDEGRIKVTDFGIARTAQEHQTRLTDTGTVIGTAHYLAPEQLEDAPPTPTSDQYAAALVVYEALTASLPFEGTNPAAIVMARLQTPPVPLRDRRPEVPESVAAVVMRGLERDPDLRFASISEMREAFMSAAPRVTRSMKTVSGNGAPASGVAGPGNAPATDDAAPTTVANLAVSPGHTTPMQMPSTRQSKRSARKAAAGPVVPAPPTSRRRGDAARKGALILLAIALSVLLGGWAIARAVRGPTIVEVPTFTAMNVADAQALAADLGLRVTTDVVDAAEAKDTVIDQTVVAGTRVESGSQVGLVVSSGVAPCCTVPPVVSLTDEAAVGAIEGAGLKVGRQESREDPAPAGTVLEQSPVAGETVERGTEVNFMSSSGPPEEDEDEDKDRGKGKGGDDD